MQQTKHKRRPTPFVNVSTLIVALLAWLLSGCATQPQRPPSPPAQAVSLPPLPQSARQGETPPECSPTCSAWLTQQRAEWQKLLNEVAPPADTPR